MENDVASIRFYIAVQMPQIAAAFAADKGLHKPRDVRRVCHAETPRRD